MNAEIFIIRSGIKNLFEQCTRSFLDTTPKGVSFVEVQEQESREKTLNKIISISKPRKSIVVIADDIILTKGWYEILENSLTAEVCFGFSMKDINGKIVNYGYKLMKDSIGRIGTLPITSWPKGKDELVKVDTFTGCFFSVGYKVLGFLNQVPVEGCNRLGELIFHKLAKDYGFDVLIHKHCLKHLAISTKVMSSTKFTSEAYLEERKIFDLAELKYNLSKSIQVTSKILVDKKLQHFLNNAEYSFWGAGTIAEFLILASNAKPQTIYSSFFEEVGKDFLGYKILDLNTFQDKSHNSVLCTVEGKSKLIRKSICSKNKGFNFYWITVTINGNNLIYGIGGPL